MDFMDIEGALHWGDDSNEKLHFALFSSSLSKKKEKKKTAEGIHFPEQKKLPQQLDGYEQGLTSTKKIKRKLVEKEDVGGHEKALFEIPLKKERRKSFKKEEIGENDTPKELKRKSINKEDHDIDKFKRFKQTDKVTSDDKSGKNLAKAMSNVTDDGQDTTHGRRKKRKRKPRNNKFEGWAKKGTSQLSEEMNGFEEGSVRVEGNVSVQSDRVKEDTPIDREIEERIHRPGKRDLEVSHIGEVLVEKQDRKDGKKKTKRKMEGREDGKDEKGVKGTKNEQNVSNKLSESDEEYSNKTADDITRESESTSKNERNFADKQSIEEQPRLIYAEKKHKGKVKGEVGGTRWEQQLRSARFRFINETLYKSSGAEAFKNFKGDRAAFEVYHEGYTQQVHQWPENPVDIIIKYLKRRPQSWIVGDFGCGEAKIAQSVHQKVVSFDIFRANENVTVCNISKVPLRTESLDVAVYCLSLMGTSWPEYLKEGNRVLKKGGLLKIAEVASRFKSVDSFISLLRKLGFTLKGKDLTNKMFFMFDFEKKKTCGQVPDKVASILKPCKYKRR